MAKIGVVLARAGLKNIKKKQSRFSESGQPMLDIGGNTTDDRPTGLLVSNRLAAYSRGCLHVHGADEIIVKQGDQ